MIQKFMIFRLYVVEMLSFVLKNVVFCSLHNNSPCVSFNISYAHVSFSSREDQ